MRNDNAEINCNSGNTGSGNKAASNQLIKIIDYQGREMRGSKSEKRTRSKCAISTGLCDVPIVPIFFFKSALSV